MKTDHICSLTTTRPSPADAGRDALQTMLRRANGGSPPDRVVVRMAGDPPAAPEVDTLTVTRLSAGGMTVDVGVATHWTRFGHRDCRFALTPGDQIILIGRDAGGTLHAWVDEGRLFFDRGSPLRTAAAEIEAIAAFDATVAGLMAEAA